MAFLDFDGLSHLVTKLKKIFVNSDKALTTSDIDDMFSGDYSSDDLKFADDEVILYLVNRIKNLERHSIQDSDE